MSPDRRLFSTTHVAYRRRGDSERRAQDRRPHTSLCGADMWSFLLIHPVDRSAMTIKWWLRWKRGRFQGVKVERSHRRGRTASVLDLHLRRVEVQLDRRYFFVWPLYRGSREQLWWVRRGMHCRHGSGGHRVRCHLVGLKLCATCWRERCVACFQI